jgi:hypothetical protein
VRGSLDRSDDPREGRYEQLKERCELVPEAGAFPSAGVGSALEGPEVNRGAPEPSVHDGVVLVAGHQREEIGTAADAQVAEPFTGGDPSAKVVCVVVICGVCQRE